MGPKDPPRPQDPPPLTPISTTPSPNLLTQHFPIIISHPYLVGASKEVIAQGVWVAGSPSHALASRARTCTNTPHSTVSIHPPHHTTPIYSLQHCAHAHATPRPRCSATLQACYPATANTLIIFLPNQQSQALRHSDQPVSQPARFRLGPCLVPQVP